MSDRPLPFPLRQGRTHEVCGAGATGFAAALTASMRGPVMWITESWKHEQLNPSGLNDFFDPDRLLVAKVKDQADVLAVAEEALRSGTVPLVVGEVRLPLDLKAGRRLKLAAQAGECVGLFLIPEDAGSNAVETRWHCTPLQSPDDSTLWRWELIKNKAGTLNSWNIRWDAASRSVIVVSKTGERPGAAPSSD